MSQRVMIVGGGVGGTIVANLLARSLPPEEARVTLIDSTAQHVYMPMWLYLPFNQMEGESDAVIRPERNLLNRHVHLIQGSVQHIDTKNHEMRVQYSEGQHEMPGTGGAREATYGYDYLVLATGARLAPSDLSGLSEGEGNGKWHHF